MHLANSLSYNNVILILEVCDRPTVLHLHNEPQRLGQITNFQAIGLD